MARIEVDPNYSSPTFSRATAATDAFKKEDVQLLAAAVSTHVHDGVHGLALTGASIPAGTITSAMIADGTIDTADLKDGSVTSAKIADGTIATADHADASVTNAKLASDTARANLLVNGGFEVWQRGNGPFTTDSAYLADRWKIYLPVGTMSVSKDTTNADTAGACAAVTVGGGPSAGNAQQIYQYPLHTSEIGLQLAGKQITFSARVRTSVASGVRLNLNPAGGTNTYSSYHTGSGAYQTLSVTATMATSPSGIGCSVAFSFEANGSYYVDNAMLVVGSQAADYAPLHPADDLARCLRYYEVLLPNGVGGGINFAKCDSATNGEFVLQYFAQKPVTPTITYSAPGTFALQNAAGTGVQCTAMTTLLVAVQRVHGYGTVASGLVAGNASVLQNWSSGSASISIEANP